jgi:hypothetical protein
MYIRLIHYSMVIRRNTFFLLLALIYIVVVGSPKLVWFLNSQKTTGIFAFQGRGNALDQLPESSSFIYFIYQSDTVWFKSLPGLGLPENSPVPVRFHKKNPRDAKLDKFRDIWMPTIVYGALPFLVLIVTFFHPHIVPWRSRVVLIPRKPFIKVIP